MKKQIFTFLSVLVCMSGSLGITACAEENQIFTVGICQFTQHDALDAATRGFKDALTDKLGDRVIFDEQNAQGDYATCTSAINGLITKDVDLILANATASLQTAATATTDIPILGTSVTEYGAALQLDDFNGTVGGNISGTSDLAPLDEQAAMVQELFPDADKVGLLYCSAEPNSQYQIDVVEKELEELGYQCDRYTFSDSNDISSVTMNAASECDVIYVPTDNTVASNAELIANICIPDKVPVIAGEENTCRGCGVATFTINYYDLGYTTGEMAVRILVDGENISDMPIEYDDKLTKRYNKEICEQLGIEVPDDYVALEAE
ncbi:MAG: ABC transporter substrate-binding protein [Lachnospiraceae bacterium]|nr:ABC transporter substrate-binding protein [Lachnospiraceae bacterium]